MAQDLINYWWLFNLFAFGLSIFYFFQKEVENLIEAVLIVVGMATVGLSIHYLPAQYSWIVVAAIGVLFVCKPSRPHETLLEENLWAMVGAFFVICGIVIRSSAYKVLT